ncbi:hypothetical protein AWC38_SpisGene2089 [Stylophora pistillata]|uniref:Uncharacterized protein n=1 Tax=Stylophora pistillata TaxID=50429 RepID=A0A2B4SVX7_STYPI|nr:hypothetical protein AWC38_SpisGene2089 [Stylophora pistillata]
MNYYGMKVTVGKKTGQLIGEKIYGKFNSDPRSSSNITPSTTSDEESDKKGSYTFNVNTTDESDPLDWYKAYFEVDLKIKKTADGTAYGAAYGAAATINGGFGIIDSIIVKFDGTGVLDSQNTNHAINIKNLTEFRDTYSSEVGPSMFHCPDTNTTADITKKVVPPGKPGERLKKSSNGDFDIESKKLINAADPTEAQDASTKAYTEKHLHTDGSRPMSGVLNMQNRKIINVADPTNKDAVNLQKLNFVVSEQTANGASVVNFKLNTELKKKADADVMINELSGKLDTTTFNAEIAKKPNASAVMLLDGSLSMTGDLNLGNKKAINSAAPSGGTDLCNKTYVDTLVGTTKTNLEKHVNDHLAHSVTTSNLKNDLDYIMNGIIGNEFSDEDDINGKKHSFQRLS